MNERSRNVAVGLTVFVGISGLLVMMLLFGYVPTWLERTYPVKVQLPHADGLAQSSPVRLHGITIGTVEQVLLTRPPRTGVIVTANIREDILLPENVQAVVASPFFGGSTTLELTVPETFETDIAYLPTDGTAQITGRRSSLVGDLGNEMRRAIEQPLGDFERIADHFEAISQEWIIVGRNVNQLVEPRDPQRIGENAPPANLHSIILKTDERLAQLETILDGLSEYTTDQQLRDDIRHTAAHARAITEQLPGQVEQIGANLDQSVTALRNRYVALADDLSGAVAVMQRLAESAERGEGALGKFLTDPSLHDNINETIQRMQHAIDDLRLLIQKWQAEGVPVQF